MSIRLSDKLKLVSDGVAAAERVACGVLISAFALILMINVLSRYLFNSPLFFAEELALLILVWMGYLAIAYSVSLDRQIGMGFVLDRLPGKARRKALIVVDLIMLGISCILLWSTIDWLQSSSVAYERTVALDVPKWPFYLIIPLFWAITVIHLLQHLVEKLSRPHEGQ